MPSVCLCLEVHQPIALRNFRFLDLAEGKAIDDVTKMKSNIQYWSEQCYSPLNAKLRELFLKYKGNFRLAFYTSGVLIQQFEQHRPDMLSSFAQLGWTNCVEFLAGTYHHSLAGFVSPTTFLSEVAQLSTKIRAYFEQEPLVFYAPELIYNDAIAHYLASKSFTGVLCEPSQEWLENNSCADVYTPNLVHPERFSRKPTLLMRNANLSATLRNIFQREEKISPAEYVEMIRAEVKRDQVAMLTLSYQDLFYQNNTQFAIDFLDEFASKWLHFPDTYFFTPSMTVARLQSKGVFEAKNGVAKGSENLEPWLGNDYQKQFLKQLTEMEGAIQYFNRPIWTKLWEQLQAVENFEALTAQKYPNLSPFKDEKEAFIALSNMITYLQLQMNKAN